MLFADTRTDIKDYGKWNVGYRIKPAAGTSSALGLNHAKTANIGFADGHVSSYSDSSARKQLDVGAFNDGTSTYRLD